MKDTDRKQKREWNTPPWFEMLANEISCVVIYAWITHTSILGVWVHKTTYWLEPVISPHAFMWHKRLCVCVLGCNLVFWEPRLPVCLCCCVCVLHLSRNSPGDCWHIRPTFPASLIIPSLFKSGSQTKMESQLNNKRTIWYNASHSFLPYHFQ